MPLTIDEVRRIAALARLRLTSAEEEKFASQLGQIVDYIDQLKSYHGQEPKEAEMLAVEASDSIADCLPLGSFQRNAPELYGSFLVVPQVKTDDE
jgi:aspartyl-tRNA(Asn)/glutamyl-tRNA(Gln) amidotransferase subunit C